MHTPDTATSRNAQSAAVTREQAAKAMSTLEAWVLLGCPGGPWRALEPLGVVRQYLDAESSTPPAPAIAPPAPDAAPAS